LAAIVNVRPNGIPRTTNTSRQWSNIGRFSRFRQDPAEIAALERDYVLEPIDGPTAGWLTRVVARRGGAS
jgi:hypothetical protein